MGKPNSCFKIITCGNDSADDLDVSERKGSSDKRGWSFHKRSARHRVLSTTVITETPTSGNKESPESAPLAFQSPASTTVPEKVSIIQYTDEKPQLLTPEIPRVSATENASGDQSKVDDKLEDENKVDEKLEAESKGDGKLDESAAAVVVQTAVSGSLAQKSLLDLKNVVKLQAAVRGHLVRRHAVGTLRCVQAIIKMQAIVRAHQSLQKDNHLSTTSKKANVSYISIEKLLSNSFARQLLESTPKNQPIHVKCDPSKPDSDSAWKWLEMWMSVSTKDTPHLKEAVSVVEQQETEKEEITESPLESKIQYCEMEESNSSIKESNALSESEESLITYDADSFNFQPINSTSFTVRHNNEQPQFENASTSAVQESAVEINLSDADSYMEFNALSEKPVIETEQPKRSMKRSATDQLETDGKKSVFGSRKVTNPAFVAAQSKFAELTSTTNSARSISPSLEDASGVESQRDTFSSEVDSELRSKEPSVPDNLVIPHGSQVQVGGSDCGTEISISSTLDSPDRSDVGATERDHEHHVKVSEERICSPDNTINIDVETKDSPETPVSNSCNSVAEPEKINVVNDETINSKVAMIPPQAESKPERTTSDVQREQDTSASMQAYGSSPEASPRSHLTVPESQQGTPSSLISVKAKRSKADKSGSNKKRMSLSAGKKSPSNPNHDSASSKDNKSGKRRNSFGSTKPDQADQEPRDSSSSSSIPHFMQATESARAKLQATTSPRSSPDVQEREIYIKKRHSLPGVKGRQGSPRIQRSMSQAQTQQGAKGSERKWQR
ncbi:protein IQ-DOMAIN 32 [Argentina anserina]|uniref:protein IQ-DOMAIN 32 n=1 Tax=Argentina anserina TaxID=57926 RepID=UPI0021767DEE|nr:protein IQ-DOMAIN 32 [Potentilla anserina]